jgi:hypothetical protein
MAPPEVRAGSVAVAVSVKRVGVVADTVQVKLKYFPVGILAVAQGQGSGELALVTSA